MRQNLANYLYLFLYNILLLQTMAPNTMFLITLSTAVVAMVSAASPTFVSTPEQYIIYISLKL